MAGGTVNTKMIEETRAKFESDLVRENLALVQYVTSEIAHRVPSHVNRGDLVSAGMLGLAQAARSFDPDRGIAFDRFASTTCTAPPCSTTSRWCSTATPKSSSRRATWVLRKRSSNANGVRSSPTR